ncbi:high choriolytic enzyme 1-like [Astyanax mexicanus]|uniref:Metalloendopeptidase n=1 Tax=Astyanax mexicanus TaxID=7994 RepID=A0A8T2KR30_ASTMX|nr:high choriolytic enzyme 1-like [Astyanax mexicanus]
MEPTASLSILALLMLGLTQAVPLMEPQHVDITTRILSTNNGSRELLLEGDIVLPRTRNALVCANNNCFWKKSSTGLVQVPFTVSADFSSTDRAVIAGAMATFHSKTCIRFVDRSTEIDYLSIENRDGCYSSLGRTGGKQVVSLSTRGCVYHGIVQHELNHALGFYHEHTRSDRDRYVTINWQNIDPTMQYNFNKENTNNLNTLYDYSSVMHYGKTAFTINGLNTITPIPDASVQIGQRVDLSIIDIQRINTLYNC